MSSKRTFPKNRFPPSVVYDASEEDLTDTDASATSMPTAVQPAHPHPPRSAVNRKSGSARAKHHLAHAITSEDDGVDSPTYDGDVESTHTVTHSRPFTPDTVLDSSASASTLTSPTSSVVQLPTTAPGHQNHAPSPLVRSYDVSPMVVTPPEPSPAGVTKASFDPAKLTPEDIRNFVADAIAGAPTEEGEPRTYKINPPPTDRPVRVYADGVYDLFHFGHALQLRQAKLSFPQVYLMVGCNSDEQVREHKSKCVMNHAERCEAIRHCRWVDEIVSEAPWVITAEFLDKYQIDYVAHDEAPYAGAGQSDVYQTCKDLGKFMPTRRTPGISTSELLERIVQQYRRRDFDPKLEKMGRSELKAAGSDYDDGSDEAGPSGTRARSRRRVKDMLKDVLQNISSQSASEAS